MTVFFDENLPPALAAGLHELEQGLKYASEGIVVVHHVVNVFGKGTKDEVWVPAAAKHAGCVIITEDWKMQRIKQLQPICREEKVVMIFFRPPSRGEADNVGRWSSQRTPALALHSDFGTPNGRSDHLDPRGLSYSIRTRAGNDASSSYLQLFTSGAHAMSMERITIDPAICHGKPCVRGLRYPVELILELLSSGMKEDEILADYPDLEHEDILAVLAYAARLSQVKRIQSLAA